MFLDTVILVLQEIVEAALLISVLMILTRLLRELWPSDFTLGYFWLFTSSILGLIGSWVYARLIPAISLWFDYVGLEVVNAFFQGLIIALLIMLCYGLTQKRLKQYSKLNLVTGILLTFIVALGIIREVSEIIIYLSGITVNPENVAPVMMGSGIALGIGASGGILLFYTLISLPSLWALRCCMILLALFTGNMASQACLLLTQADWLPYTPELWNSSSVLPEYTVPGQLLYALVGYEATPSALQFTCYCVAALLILISPLFKISWSTKRLSVIA
jgi:high-affinity iron transporter